MYRKIITEKTSGSRGSGYLSHGFNKTVRKAVTDGRSDQVTAHNKDRFEDIITAGWDLIIVDEAHRLSGSSEMVARYKLGLGSG